MKRIFTTVAVILALSLPMIARAGEPTDRVKGAVDKVVATLKDPALKGAAKEKERRAKIRDAVFGVWDFREMAQRSLGVHWKERSEADRKEFVELFSDLLERSYINRIEAYHDEKIVFVNEKPDGDYTVVQSKFVTKRREEIPVDYKMIKKDGKWWVYDLVVENVSLVNNYRVQFNKIIRSSSYDELVRKMKNKRESEQFVSPGEEK